MENFKVPDNANVCGEVYARGEVYAHGNPEVAGDAWVFGKSEMSGEVHPIPKPTEGEMNPANETKDPGYYSEQTANEPLPTWWLWFELATMLAFTVASAVLYLYLTIPTGLLAAD